MDNLIPLAEYAKIHNKAFVTVRQKAQRGGFNTARKVGRNWVIDKNEPYIDLRKREGEIEMVIAVFVKENTWKKAV